MITEIDELIHLKLVEFAEIKQKVSEWKRQGEKIVFTNGCFDLLHIGHISYMLKAASLGTKLIIGLNSDKSVKSLKGESRPINSEYSRSIILASLFFVDAVVVFNEKTPLNLINAIMPSVLAKGGDYNIDNIVGATEVIQNGGKVELIHFIEGYSSSSIINKMNISSS